MSSVDAARGDAQAAVDQVIKASGEAAVKVEELLDRVGTLLDVHEARIERLERDVGISPDEPV
jgi:hypothetical protein